MAALSARSHTANTPSAAVATGGTSAIHNVQPSTANPHSIVLSERRMLNKAAGTPASFLLLLNTVLQSTIVSRDAQSQYRRCPLQV